MPTSGSYGEVDRVSIFGDTMTGALDINRPLTTDLSFSTSLPADANERLVMLANGTMAWGDGTNPVDAVLFRSGPGALGVNGSFGAALIMTEGATPVSPTWGTKVAGDTDSRFAMDASGHLYWGTGSGLPDTELFRSAAGVLKTGSLVVENAVSTTVNFTSRITGEAENRFNVLADGTLQFGGGVVAPDALLFRIGTNVLQTGTVHFQRTLTTTPTIRTNIVGDTTNRLQILAGGRVEWSSGTAAVDTVLQRTGVAALGLTGSFTASATMTAPRVVASPQNAGLGTGVNNGHVISSATNDLTTFNGMDLAGSTFGFFAVNKWYSGAAWVDNGLARLGGALQITNDALGYYSINTGTTTTQRFFIASGGNVAIGTNTPAAKLSFDAATTAAGGILFGADTNLYRAAADTLRSDDTISSLRSAAAGMAFQAVYTGNVATSFAIFADGKHEWGNGTNPADTNLYRSAADTLRTDDNAIINLSLRVNGNVGFYNTAPVAKPTVTGSRGANDALASLLTALAGQGLLTDSSTA